MLKCGCALFLLQLTISLCAATLQVPPLPEDNLIRNPWFRNISNTGPGMNDWTTDGHWGASDKDGNPTPDAVLGTSARISTGRGANSVGKTVDPGVDTFLSQVVSANPDHRMLRFDMYWVTHTLQPGQVTIYGADSTDGPWTAVWRPFYQVFTKMIIPETREGQDLWLYYSDLTSLVTTHLVRGYPFYKLEVHANLPDEHGGFKITGVYFSTAPSADRVYFEYISAVQDAILLTFARPTGQKHIVQYSDLLALETWLTLTNLPPVSEPERQTVTDPDPARHQRFYRVLTEE